ncbi:MAG TPA: hypothetical protein VF779_01085, partial [Pyrinomonadaceae bacterium]
MSETSEQNLFPTHGERGLKTRRWLALSIVLLGCAGVVLIIVSSWRVSASQTARETLGAEFLNVEAQEPQGDFTKFSHTQTHAALPCLLCHRRESNSPQPSLPGHTPCAGCHAQRFNDSQSPICTICHMDVASGKVKPFPRLQSFNMKFNHALHMTGAARPGNGCVT